MNVVSCWKRCIHTRHVVKVLSLDARDTLITTKESPSVVYSKFAADRGLNINADVVFPNFVKNYKITSQKYPCFGHKSIGEREWWTGVVQSTLLDSAPGSSKELTVKVSNDLFDFYSTKEPWQLVEPDIRSTLQKFRLKGISLVITSNFDSRLKLLLKLFNIDDLFSMILLSGDVGFEKPDKRIFELILKYFDLSSSSEILHIGDNLKNDYSGARNFGCKSLLFDPFNTSTEVSTIDRVCKLSSLNLY